MTFKMNVYIPMKWIFVNVPKTSYSIHRPSSDLPPITILFEEPLTDKKLKIISLCKSNLQKVNEMPGEVLVDLWKALYVEKYYLAKSGA